MEVKTYKSVFVANAGHKYVNALSEDFSKQWVLKLVQQETWTKLVLIFSKDKLILTKSIWDHWMPGR